MRKIEIVLREYVSKLSTENLKFLYERLNNRLGGDIAEVLEFLSKNSEVDKWFSSARSAIELFSMVDNTQEFVDKEYGRRLPDLIV